MLKVLYGAEPYLVNEKVREITKDIDDMNVAHFDELTSAVFQTAQQYPFLASRQAIVVDIDKLGACEELLSAKIPEFTDFIVCPKVVDERTKVFKALKKAGCVDECKKMDLQSLKKAIREKVSERGCSISDEMIENFVQHIGYFVDENVSLYTINIVLKQLCFGTVEISMDDIVALVPRSVNVKMWELSTVLMDLDAKKLYQMADVIKGKAYRTPRLTRFGYITLEQKLSVLGHTDLGSIPAHEFHYFDSNSCGEAFHASKPESLRGWECIWGSDRILAGFPHLYYYGNPRIPQAFLERCLAFRQEKSLKNKGDQ